MSRARLSRLFSIVLILQSKEWVPAQDLADRMSVSLRTIYRDVSILQEHNVPIEGVTGPDGGYRLASKSPLPEILLNDTDAFALFVLGATRSKIPSLLSSLRSRAIDSISESLRPEITELMERAASRIYFDTSEWYWRDDGAALLPQVREAVFNSHIISATYQSRYRAAPRSVTIEPYGIVWKGGHWYLVGREDNSELCRRRLSRFITLAVEEEVFIRQDNFDLELWWKNELEYFGRGDTKVTLRVQRDAQRELQYLSTKSDSRVYFRDDVMYIELHVDQWEWIAPLLMSFGGSVQALEPSELRSAMRKMLSSALVHYMDADEDCDLPMQQLSQSDSRSRASSGRELSR